MNLKGYVDRFKAVAEPVSWETAASKEGCKLYARNWPSERYEIDFADGFTSEGWEQFDTDQDAWYFGVWVNPKQLVTLTYAEGDWTLVECPDVTVYNRQIARMVEFHGEGRVALVIDADGSATSYHQDRSLFIIDETTT